MNTPTPQEFIEGWPLYTRADIVDFDAPKAISRKCNGDCKKETTWSLGNRSLAKSGVGDHADFYVVSYTCDLCGERTLTVMYRKLDWHRKPELAPAPVGYFSINEWQHGAVQKVGQIPPPSIAIPSELQKRLGPTAVYYKQGVLCRSQNLGIAAVAYMRRVIEEKTEELVDVVVELARTYGVEAKAIEGLLAAKKKVRYEEKLQVASEVIPEAMRPGGVNPIGQLYIHLSIGTHGKTDDECVAIFDDLRQDFEYVFRNLHAQAKERREFVQRVQSRAGKAT